MCDVCNGKLRYNRDGLRIINMVAACQCNKKQQVIINEEIKGL